jgi:uncharacterized protein (DUF2141 family)
LISCKTLIVAATLILACGQAMAQLPSLKVNITGATPSTGSVEVSLFDSAEQFMVEPHLQESGAVDENGEFRAEFYGLEEGTYAVLVVYDENDNGVLDTGFLGFGGENIGYSNNVRPWLGRPSFEEVRIDVTEPDHQIAIELQ